MVQKAKARRGRPPAYDADAAMASVMDVFWHAGYAATSLDDIGAATGMNRPSLYGAFGDKRALYGAALERYRTMARAAMTQALAHDRPLRQVIGSVYTKALSLYLSGPAAPRGCFMIGTALTEAVGDPDLRKALGDGLRDIEAAFASRIRLAQKQVPALAPILDQSVPKTLCDVPLTTHLYLSEGSTFDDKTIYCKREGSWQVRLLSERFRSSRSAWQSA